MARALLFVCLAAAAFSMIAATEPTTSAATTEVPTAAPTAAPTTAPTRAPTTVDPRCQPACPNKKAGKVPNLCRCQAYFECSKKGEATARLCKPWQNFDPKQLQCRYWDQVDCTWLITTTVAPTTPAPTTTTRAPPVPGCDWRPECPASGSSKQGIPCKGACASYIQCSDGVWTKKSCGILQKFDVNKLKCVMWGAQCAA